MKSANNGERVVAERIKFFFALLSIMPNAGNRLDAIHGMRVVFSTTEPNIAELIAKKQVHPSR